MQLSDVFTNIKTTRDKNKILGDKFENTKGKHTKKLILENLKKINI